jgi:hypothetical protein
MAAKGGGAAEEWYVVQRWGVGGRWGADTRADEDATDGGAAWIAYPDEGMRRASAALAHDGDVWVVDPVDTPELDDLLSEMGEVRGVAVLLDRHYRDADDVADRHDVPVFVPDWFSGVPEMDADVERFGDRLPDTDYRARRVVDNRVWQEAALFDGETLVVPEALGTADYFAPGDQPLGVHPMLRLFPPRDSLGGLGPERILVGHGEGVDAGAPAALDAALASARTGAPKSMAKMLSGMLRG